MRRVISCWVIISFVLTSLFPYTQAHADVLGLPRPGIMVGLTPAYVPVIVKGLRVHPENPILFDFIVDTGNSGLSVHDPRLKIESEKLIKYFLASLTIPDNDLWVNLSPYEKDRIITGELGQTVMGRDMLAEDYVLKQLTASLIYPEKNLGKEFWNTVYAKSRELYGTSQVPVNTFNKVWIVADKAKVYVHDHTAFVVASHLKVMLEEDYLALSHHVIPAKVGIHSLGSQIIRSIILPELEKEVNYGRNFANLRQIFHSMILAAWYKKNLKEALLNQVYSNKNKINGIDVSDKGIKAKIYEQYLEAYRKGVFSYIKEDSLGGQTVPRKYFSGGLRIDAGRVTEIVGVNDPSVVQFEQSPSVGNWAMVSATASETTSANAAMITAKSTIILDSRGNQTLRVFLGTAVGNVPSGASTGEREAVELRDGDFVKAVRTGQRELAIIDKNGKIYMTQEELIRRLTDGKLKTQRAMLDWLAKSPRDVRVAKLFTDFLLEQLLQEASKSKDVVDFTKEGSVDRWLLQMEDQFGGPGSRKQKGYFGANAILGISNAAFLYAASLDNKPPYAFNKGPGRYRNVIFQANVLNGGVHADNPVDIQETMLTVLPDPNGRGINAVRTEQDAIRAGAEIFQSLKRVLQKRSLSTLVGDEGGFAPSVPTYEDYLKLVEEAVTNSKYAALWGKQIGLSADGAFSERTFQEAGKTFYWMEGETSPIKLSDDRTVGLRRHVEALKQEVLVLTGEEVAEYWQDLMRKYPFVSLEDVFSENDMESHARLTAYVNQVSMINAVNKQALPFEIQQKMGVDTVGDDLLVTSLDQLKAAVRGGQVRFGDKILNFPPNTVNSILVKINQVGTITESRELIKWALEHGISVKISHRSGETEDTLIAHIAVWATTLKRKRHAVTGRLPGVWIKTGSFARSDRTAKYNELIGIYDEIAANDNYPSVRRGVANAAVARGPESQTRTADAALLAALGTGYEMLQAAKASDPNIKVEDQYVGPIIKVRDGKPVGLIQRGDSFISFNFRRDRTNEETQALAQGKDFEGFEAEDLDLDIVTMMEDEHGFIMGPDHVAFPPVYIPVTLGEYLSKLGKKQFRTAETEKYRHVTRFFNGGWTTEPFEGEERNLIPSPKGITFDQRPEMSSYEVTFDLIKRIQRAKDDLFVVNYANPDMVGHTGNLEKTIQAIYHMNNNLSLLISQARKANLNIIITADHGNADEMLDKNGEVQTKHSTNLVPFVFIPSKTAQKTGVPALKQNGGLADVAPSILHTMGLPQPPEMTGQNLIEGYNFVEGEKTILIVLDGFGINPDRKNAGDAIRIASQRGFTPFLDRLFKRELNTQISASGEAVGLPKGTMGNSEVGHAIMGSGRILDSQPLVRVNNAIERDEGIAIPDPDEDGKFSENRAILHAINNAKEKGAALHLWGLVSDGKIHSSMEHIYKLLELAKAHGLTRVYIHAVLDGRDTPPQSAATYLSQLQEKIDEIGIGEIVDMIGREWAMDRDWNWNRIKIAYDLYVYGKAEATWTDSDKAMTAIPYKLIKDGYFAGLPDAQESLRSLDLSGVRVLFRVNLNVSIKDGKVSEEDTARLLEAIPMLKMLLEQGADVILAGHNGRAIPKDSRKSVAATAEFFQAQFPDTSVKFYPKYFHDDGSPLTSSDLTRDPEKTGPGSISILENIRYADEEKSFGDEKREQFGRLLTSLADIYIVDAFADMDSKGVTMEDLPGLFVQAGKQIFIGPSMVKESEALSAALKNGVKAVISGAEKEEKLGPAGRSLVGVEAFKKAMAAVAPMEFSPQEFVNAVGRNEIKPGEKFRVDLTPEAEIPDPLKTLPNFHAAPEGNYLIGEFIEVGGNSRNDIAFRIDNREYFIEPHEIGRIVDLLSPRGRRFITSFDALKGPDINIRAKRWKKDRYLTWSDLKSILSTTDELHSKARQAAIVLLASPQRRNLITSRSEARWDDIWNTVLKHTERSNEQSYFVRKDSFLTLGEMNLEDALPVLIDGLLSRKEEDFVRGNIVLYLKSNLHFLDDETKPALKAALEKVAENDANRYVRSIAQQIVGSFDDATMKAMPEHGQADHARDGGIDLNARNMSMDITGEKADIHFNQAMVANFKRGDFSGVRPQIVSITPVADINLLLK